MSAPSWIQFVLQASLTVYKNSIVRIESVESEIFLSICTRIRLAHLPKLFARKSSYLDGLSEMQ